MSTWKPIPGYEGYYEVSSDGQIRSISRMTVAGRWMSGRTIRTSVTSAGYLAFTASADRIKRTVFVHQAVILAHAGPRPKGAIVRHLDGNPKNNSLDNLAWGTTSENAHDAVAHGANRWANRTHCTNGHEFTPENTRIRKKGTGSARVCRECNRQRMRADNDRRVARRREARRRAAA